MEPRQLTRRDFALLALFAGVMMGFSLVGGRVLTMHESRLPQAAREMMADGDWIVPKCGGRPWLERPPLPHWITVGVASLFGRCDQEWIVRIPPALMGMFCVLMLASMSARWFGRGIGLLTGAILSTSVEFLSYAWLAEEDIFLAASVIIPFWLFDRLDVDVPAPGETQCQPHSFNSHRFLGGRSWSVLAFFLTLGLTNLVKGLLFGAAMVLVTILGYLAWNANWQRTRRYVWVWGWLAAGLAAVAWMIAASYRHPDLLDLWRADAVTRTDGLSRRDPFWTYPVSLIWCMAPWFPASILGLQLTWKRAKEAAFSPERFLWCWAILPVALLSLAHHKHHHYLVPSLAPWAVLCALGVRRGWQIVQTWSPYLRNPAWGTLGVGLPLMVAVSLRHHRIPGPDWIWQSSLILIPVVLWTLFWATSRPNPRLSGGLVFGLVGLLQLTGHVYAGQYVDTYREDTRFLKTARQIAGKDRRIYLNGQGMILNMFRHLFYLDDHAQMLHNLTFLQDEAIREPRVLLIGRYQDREALETYGKPKVLAESQYYNSKRGPQSRWTLFELEFSATVKRFPNRATYTAKQVMEREAGPFLGENPPEVLRIGERVDTQVLR